VPSESGASNIFRVAGIAFQFLVFSCESRNWAKTKSSWKSDCRPRFLGFIKNLGENPLLFTRSTDPRVLDRLSSSRVKPH
jgi:hypothetical protein